jgi:hypothetical protein
MPPISSFFCRWLVKNPFFIFAATLLFDEKTCQSAAQPLFRTRLETSNRPPNIKCIVPAFLGDQFIEKDGGLRIHNPAAEEVRGLEVFFYYADQLWTLIKNSSLTLKIKNI